MIAPLMPRATAVWLIENTTLTFEQIADFCRLHLLEIQAIADGDIAVGMMGQDPITSGQLTLEEIQRCQTNPSYRLEMKKLEVQNFVRKSKYTPLAKRQSKPDGIAWLLKEYPWLPDASIARLIGSTKTTIDSIRSKTHRNINEIKPQHPVLLGLCSRAELDTLLEKYKDRSSPIE